MDLGAGDTNHLAAVLRAQSRGQLYAIGQGQNLIETVHVRNLIHAAQQDAARGRVYFVTDDSPLIHTRFCEHPMESCGVEGAIPALTLLPGCSAWWTVPWATSWE